MSLGFSVIYLTHCSFLVVTLQYRIVACDLGAGSLRYDGLK